MTVDELTDEAITVADYLRRDRRDDLTHTDVTDPFLRRMGKAFTRYRGPIPVHVLDAWADENRASLEQHWRFVLVRACIVSAARWAKGGAA